jgi:hypothetical protein
MTVHPKVRRNPHTNLSSGFKATQSQLPQVIYLMTGLNAEPLCNLYFRIVQKWVKAEGKVSAVKRLKDCYLLALRSMVDRPIELPYIRTTKRGFPRSFSYMERFYNLHSRSPQAMQAVLSVMNYYRNILAPGKPNFDPITDQGPIIPSNLIDEIIELGFNPEWIIKPKRFDPVKLALRSKAGPNGQSVQCALQDLAVLSDEQVENIKYFISRHDDEDMIKNSMQMLRTKVKGITTGHHSKLAIKRELGGKNRVFAMVDYWSQLCLTPLHDGLSKLLREIEEDCTFDQSKGLGKIKDWSHKGIGVSIDLTSATDRFPVELIRAMLEKMVDKEYSQAWMNIMVDRDFSYKGKTFRWKVGQPLGAHSSFPSFALAHHMVMRAAYKKANLPIGDYYLLGDDMAAVNSEAILEYRNYLRLLGVETSPTKGLDGNSIEFAKRVFYKGCEVSPVPVHMLQTMLKDKVLIAEFIAKVRERCSESNIDLRLYPFLDQLSDKFNWNREELSILSEYPIPQMRYSLSNTAPPLLKGVMSEVVKWGSKRALKSDIWDEYNEVRFSQLISQLDELTRSGRASMASLGSVELPATATGIRRMHPIYSAYGNYFDKIEESRKEVRGYLASSDRWIEVPQVHTVNVTYLLKGSIKAAKHSGKLLLEVYKRIKEVPTEAHTTDTDAPDQ